MPRMTRDSVTARRTSPRPAAASASTACSASGPSARIVMRAAAFGGQHHDAHDALAVHRHAVLEQLDLGVEAAGQADDLRRRPRVEAVLVHDRGLALDHGSTQRKSDEQGERQQGEPDRGERRRRTSGSPRRRSPRRASAPSAAGQPMSSQIPGRHQRDRQRRSRSPAAGPTRSMARGDPGLRDRAADPHPGVEPGAERPDAGGHPGEIVEQQQARDRPPAARPGRRRRAPRPPAAAPGPAQKS